MIIDRLDNAGNSMLYPQLAEAMEFLGRLGPDTPDGEHEIRGREIFARVMRYRSIPRHEGRMESHRRYADIQALLTGRECIEWSPLSGDEAAEYDPEADVSFHPVPARPVGSVYLRPGLFALFMPEDAHMPMIMADDEPADVTKVVIKVDVSLIRKSFLD